MSEYRSVDFSRAYNQLCHLAALSASGQVEAALDNLTITTLALDPELGAWGAKKISEAVFELFGLRPPVEDIDGSLDRLHRAGSVTREDSRWAPTDDAQQIVNDRAQSAAELESAVRAEWVAALDAAELGDGLPPEDQLWACLQGFMARVFRRHGVQTLALLAPEIAVVSGEFSLSSFLDEARQEAQLEEYDADLIASAVESFFNSVSPARAQYLVQLLDGTFTFFALTVDDVTAEFLNPDPPNSPA